MDNNSQGNAAEIAAVSRNIAMTTAIIELMDKLTADSNEAVCALLTVVTVMIGQSHRPEQRLEALSAFLAPTIEEWLTYRTPVTIQ